MTQTPAAAAGGRAYRHSMQGLLRLTSGLLLAFVAIGFGSWFSGGASWVAFYLGARGHALASLAQVMAGLGFAIGVGGTAAWYARRCRRGSPDIPAAAALVACFALPVGNIFWAIFVDAIAYHHGQDVVRPAFDYAIMYVVLGPVPVLAVGSPWLVSRLRALDPRPRQRGSARAV